MKDILEKIATETVNKAYTAAPINSAEIELCLKYFFGKEGKEHYVSNSNFFYFCESGLLCALAKVHSLNNPLGMRN